MRKIISWQATLILTMLVILTGWGCKKNEDPPSKTSLLTSGNWKLTAQTYHGDYDGDGQVDPVDYNLYAELDDCDKDDFLKFNADGTGTIDEGPSKCDPSDPQTESAQWHFTENETILKVQQGLITLDFKILELTGTTLKTELTDPFSGTTDKIIQTYSH